MRKIIISRLFLYRNRFYIGYVLLGLAFIALLVFMPSISPDGLSETEVQSAVTSYNLNFSSLTSDNVIDLPYHVLQKISILVFGLTYYAIKLPSILIGLALGFLLILLLNRWFKNNVALFASILTILSSPFLYLAGSGTPLIMLVFWPTFLLWLGSKIQGVKKPRPSYCFIFAAALLLSLFTPHLIYLAVFIVLFAMIQPHLRFTVTHLPKVPLVISGIVIIAGLVLLGINISAHPETIVTLLAANGLTASSYFGNIGTAFVPFFSWSGGTESLFLSPLIGLATIAIALTGLISTAKGFFASRNSIASCFIIFTVILAGFNPDSAILIILPLSILIAHGLRYILEKWYGLFPENPYARIFAILPISIFLGIIIVSDLTHFTFGYRYDTSVAINFSNDLALVHQNLDNKSATLLVEENTLSSQFYSILNEDAEVYVTTTLPENVSGPIAILGNSNISPSVLPKEYQLHRIVTSQKSDNSARIYIYTRPGVEQGQ